MDSALLVIVKKGSAKPLHAGHPWVFADAIARIEGLEGAAPRAGAEVRVQDERGTFLGRGFLSPDSALPVRLFTRDDQAITPAFFEARIDGALALRKTLGLGTEKTNAYRLINSEGDGLPGVVVDVYGEWLVLQSGTSGIEQRLPAVLDILEARFKPKGILDRGDARTRALEKLPPPGLAPLRGSAPEQLEFAWSGGVRQAFDLRPGQGQKTGLYLDQCENRQRFAEFARGRDVLDVFCHGGGFSLHAAAAGAKSLTLIDSSPGALELAKTNFEQNHIDDADLYQAEWKDGLKTLRDAGRKFDLIVVDPPKFARAKAALNQALGAYRDLNAQAARLLRPGGILFTCSCSGNVSELEFERAVASGIRLGGRNAALLERRGMSRDHPVPPGFSQGLYLKCLILAIY